MGPYTYVTQMQPPNWNDFQIDGSILQFGDSLYLLFSGSTATSPQSIYITPMSDPVTISGDAVMISTPTLPFEMVGGSVNEGPEAIIVGETVNIVYSASQCATDNYALGMLSLTPGSDPLDPTQWTKATQPVFSQNPDAGVFGPGHHFMFQPNPGEWYFAYHANPESGQGCGDFRTTRVQPFNVNDVIPIFPIPVATGVPVPNP